MKVGVLIIGKETGHNDRKGTDWYRVKFVVTISSESPVLIGQVIDKFVDQGFYDSVVVDPTSIVEFDVVLRSAYNPQYADLHLTVDIVEDEGGE